MGYSTEFKGTLKFTHELSVPQLKKLQEFFGADPREHPEWGLSRDHGYIDLELTKDYSGIQWDGAEKTRDLDKSVSFIIREMRKEWPEFGLSGVLQAQGEDMDDRWELRVAEDGTALKCKVPISWHEDRMPALPPEVLSLTGQWRSTSWLNEE